MQPNKQINELVCPKCFREKVKQERQKQMKLKKLQEAREKGLISPSSDWTLDSDGEPARRSDLVKYAPLSAITKTYY